MRSGTKSRALAARVIPVAVLGLLLLASNASARVLTMVGNVAGTVNGAAVDFGLHITMDLETGEETATVSEMDPAMGAILRPVTGLVTIAGPTGGATPQGGSNLFDLSGGDFVNKATMFWPSTGDRLELIHTVSYAGGDTLKVSATIDGTVPTISDRDEVRVHDFSEILYWKGDRCAPGKRAETAQVVTTGVGFDGDFSDAKFRAYDVGGKPFPGGGGKGSTTSYLGVRPSGPVVRSARAITSTYDPGMRTMNVHLFNTLTPVEAARCSQAGNK